MENMRQGSSKEGNAQNKPMSVSDRFVGGLVELGERHNQMHRAEYYKPATRCNHNEQELNKAIDKQKNVALRAIGQQKVYNFFSAFSVELGTKTKTNYKAHENTSRAT
jgi:hypothetical protein